MAQGGIATRGPAVKPKTLAFVVGLTILLPAGISLGGQTTPWDAAGEAAPVASPVIDYNATPDYAHPPTCVVKGGCIDFTNTEFCGPGPYFCAFGLEGDEEKLDAAGKAALREQVLASWRAQPECLGRDPNAFPNGCSDRADNSKVQGVIPTITLPPNAATPVRDDPFPAVPTMTLTRH
jgi:hypothetical protein